jgi:beta-phosphoglucomutase-like phosphatase (HAD superfamily)
MPANEQRELWEAKEQRYRDISKGMKALPGLSNLISFLSSKGVKIIIVTNAPRIEATHTLKVLQLEGLMKDMVIGNECTRGKVSGARISPRISCCAYSRFQIHTSRAYSGWAAARLRQ